MMYKAKQINNIMFVTIIFLGANTELNLLFSIAVFSLISFVTLIIKSSPSVALIKLFFHIWKCFI